MTTTNGARPGPGTDASDATFSIDPTVDDDVFWKSRPVLEHILDFSRARMTAPWAVLGVVLARVVTSTPPWVVLPKTVGGYGSLNLFIGLVGASGAGKGAATATAKDAILIPGGVFAVNVGSGEGLAHAFVKREKGELVRINDAALVSIPEIDSLTSLSTRTSATILPELRKAWSGEDLGFQYADPTKRLVVESHSYRLSLIAGIQPERAEALLNDSDGGTPQRFVWLPAVDPGAPDDEPEEPAPMSWRWAQGREDPFHARVDGKYAMPVFEGAIAAIKEARRAQNRGLGHPLDGHRLLARLKIAAALGLLDCRPEVSADDWELAGVVLSRSDETRDQVQSVLRAMLQQASLDRAIGEGNREMAKTAHVHARRVDRVGRSLLGKLPPDGSQVTGSAWCRSLNSRDRDVFEDAALDLRQRGLIQVQHAVGPQDKHRDDPLRGLLYRAASL